MNLAYSILIHLTVFMPTSGGGPARPLWKPLMVSRVVIQQLRVRRRYTRCMAERAFGAMLHWCSGVSKRDREIRKF